MSGPETPGVPRTLVERIVQGSGKASPDLRAGAFNNENVPSPLAGLIDKVAGHSAAITDADYAAAAAAGFDDDQLFELVIFAAVGQANRQYEAGLAALADAVTAPGGA